VSSVLRPHQHSIGYTGDGFYRSKDPTNSIKVLKERMLYSCTHKATVCVEGLINGDYISLVYH